MPFNVFITQFTVKWEHTRLAQLYHSITKHKTLSLSLSPFYSSNFFIFIFLSSHFVSFHYESLKSSWKLFITLARFNWLRFMDVEWAWQHQWQGMEKEKRIFCHFHHTSVSSHKSCFAKLTFLYVFFPFFSLARTQKTRSFFSFFYVLFGEGIFNGGERLKSYTDYDGSCSKMIFKFNALSIWFPGFISFCLCLHHHAKAPVFKKK